MSQTLNNNESDNQLIDALGGSVAVARMCGVSSQAVSQWRKNGIPRPWKMILETKKSEQSNPEEESHEPARTPQAN